MLIGYIKQPTKTVKKLKIPSIDNILLSWLNALLINITDINTNTNNVEVNKLLNNEATKALLNVLFVLDNNPKKM